MKIDQVYITTARHHIRLARCCVASIRHWHPEIPIVLLKDESNGPYSTHEIERCWNVESFDEPHPLPGGGWAKLEPLLRSQGRRCLILDSDTLFLGPLLHRLERHECDFVIEGVGGGPIPGREDWMARDYFRPEALRALDPDFVFPGFTFNTGALLGTSGILTRADFDPWVQWGPQTNTTHPEVFGGIEQGVLNYVLTRKAQRGELTLERLRFMVWGFGAMPPISRGRGREAPPMPCTDPPTLVHWAGKKHPIFWPTPNAQLLHNFDALYHARVPGGGLLRRARAGRALGTFAWHSLRRRLLRTGG